MENLVMNDIKSSVFWVALNKKNQHEAGSKRRLHSVISQNT
jgi:hypothetical protein